MSETRKVTPFLWFEGKAMEAAEFYTSLFDDGRIVDAMRTSVDIPGSEESVVSVTFEIGGQQYIAFNGGPHFKLSEAVSLFVQCDTQEEIDRLWEALSDGGTIQQCGWLKDRYGLSWQIVPAVLGQMLGNADRGKAQRAMDAMMTMQKFDIDALEKACAGN